ncbi:MULTISPECIES: SDR family NAD(P)-dependent oxidoreductase [Agrobacterium]|uniref:SDR family oxidoreductase n=1 Tax=Agrobacterium rubi TaxID=28099 RepID=A0AAE7R8T8_9HYPH|nr:MULTISPECIES: SDR family NAD(P)-dependent oxidoreductase [Agrobacterium]MBN7809214.1 SDR family oxidoreductase [Agrobacterium rosae]NTE89844.1 SDR family oxidoreductase [Agrobacterium rubi]NTF05306.1 SDR family oxidoreductase [Agrobacterium rubi]NTF39750.1 SDR family oxidoreductase [Agrobacterium rubi]OCJ44933.1 oxidoreductase [Agrobacterium rubi]
MDENKGEVAIVTGGGIGIGRATCMALAKAGYTVAVTDVLASEADAVTAEIIDHGGKAKAFHLDVRDSYQVDAVMLDIEANLGPVEVVVANAGIAHRVPFKAMTDERWDLTFDINLKGIMRVVRAAAPGMKKRRSGAVVALSSIMGVAYGWDQHVHYSAAKHGVVGLVRGLAVELARDGIRVNGVAPGNVRTAQTLSEEHSLGEDGLRAVASYIPLGRVGEPEEIADVIVFLASHGARYMTGEVVVVDGGLLPGRY